MGDPFGADRGRNAIRASGRLKVEVGESGRCRTSSAALAFALPHKGEKMGVLALEHVTIRCAQLQRTRDFYVELVGLTEGARPNFPFRGYWLYLGGVPVVHLVEASDKAGAWSREIVIPDAASGTGSFVFF